MGEAHGRHGGWTCRHTFGSSTPSSRAAGNRQAGIKWRRVTVELDFPLPTWNRVLAMSVRERARLKRLTKQLISELLATGAVSQTPTGCVLSGSSTPSLLEDYLRMIGRSASSASNGCSGERTLVVIEQGAEKFGVTPLHVPLGSLGSV